MPVRDIFGRVPVEELYPQPVPQAPQPAAPLQPPVLPSSPVASKTGGEKLKGGEDTFEQWAAKAPPEESFEQWASYEPPETPGLFESLGNALQRGFSNYQLADSLQDIDTNPVGYIDQQIKNRQTLEDNPGSASLQAIQQSGQGSLGDILKAFVTNPLGAVEMGLESTGSFVPATLDAGTKLVPAGVGAGAGIGGAMLGVPGAIAGGLTGGRVGLMASVAAASGSMEATESLAKTLRSAGYDPENPAHLLEAVQRPELMELADAEAKLRGAPVSALDAVSMGIAGGMLGKAGQGVARKLAGLGAETAAQGALGATGSVARDLAAGDPVDKLDAVSEAMLEFSGAGPGAAKIAAGAGINRLQNKAREATQPQAPAPSEPSVPAAQQQQPAQADSGFEPAARFGDPNDPNSTVEFVGEQPQQPEVSEADVSRAVIKEAEKNLAQETDPDRKALWQQVINDRQAMVDAEPVGAKAQEERQERPTKKAFHGTPHKMKKFTAKAAGSGEGAQAFGQGMYFAESKGVAEFYKKSVTGESEEIQFKGKHISEAPWAEQFQSDPYVFNRAMTLIKSEILGDSARNDAILEKNPMDWERKAIELGRKHREDLSLAENEGRLYEVDLDVSDNEIVAWDEKVGSQKAVSEKVVAAVSNAGKMGADAARRLIAGKTWGQVHNALVKNKGVRPSTISSALLNEGIKGSKYLDAQSRKRGDGSYNYVIFDDESVSIQKENGSYLSELGANPFMSPRVFIGATKTLLKAVGAPELISRLGDERAEFGRAIKTEAGPKNSVKQFAQEGVLGMLESNQQSVRRIGDKAPALKPIVDDVTTKPGSGEFRGRTYGEAYSMASGRLSAPIGAAQAIFDKANKTLRSGKRYAKISGIARALRGDKNVSLSKPDREVVTLLRKFYDDTLKFMKDAGVKIGEVENYLQRPFDQDLIRQMERKRGNNDNPFTIQLTKAYRERFRREINALDDIDAIESAKEELRGDEWKDFRKRMRDNSISDSEKANMARSAMLSTVDEKASGYAKSLTRSILTGTFGNQDFWGGFTNLEKLTGTGAPSFTKGRVFGPEADKYLSAFYEKDIFKMAADYLHHAVSRAERVRRFGEGDIKLRNALEEARKEGQISDEDSVEFMQSIASIMGMHPHTVRAYDPIYAFARLKSSLKLVRTFITAIPEPAVIAAWGNGSPLKGWLRTAPLMMDAMKEFVRGEKSRSDGRRMAEFLGLVADDAVHNAMLHRYGNVEFGTGYENRLIMKMMQLNFTHRQFKAQIATSVKAGELAINDLVREYNKSVKKGRGIGFDRENLADMGIDPARVDEFVKWHADYYAKPIDQRMATLANGGEMAEMYETAVARFSEQTIQRGRAETKNKWASRNRFVNLLFHLTQFNYSLHENFILRNSRMIGRGWKGTAQDGSKMRFGQRLGALSAVARFAPIALAAYYADQYLRQPLQDLFGEDNYDEDDEETWKRIAKGIDRGGGFGKMSPIVNAVFAVSYNAEPVRAGAGPFIADTSNVVKATAKALVDNSDTNNSAERALMRELYKYFIKDGVLAAINAAAPLPGSGVATKAARGAAIGGIQAAGSPSLRERFVDQTAGRANARTGRKRRSRGRGGLDGTAF